MANNLAKIRKEKGFSQYELGFRIGRSQVTIYTWEHGYRLPSPEDMQQLAKVLDVHPEEIALQRE